MQNGGTLMINETILSIPPYISTSWDQVSALYMKGDDLIVVLLEGETIAIPHLSEKEIDQIFTLHSKYLEKEELIVSSQTISPSSDIPFQLDFGSMGNMQSAMQHNPEQANSPDLPLEVLQKISSVAKILLPNDPESIPKAEPHCNCFYCQVARTIHQSKQSETQEQSEQREEAISAEELQFQQWEIKQEAENLFQVSNRLDPHEKYNVYLGDPIGCTCGSEGCEHVLAVLRS